MITYKHLRPFAFLLPPETAHRATVLALKYNLVPPQKRLDYSRLHTRVMGLTFENPIGLAAGFDKNAECLSSLVTQGFGFIEVGTVTPKPQIGNAKPRLFRLVEDEAVINRMGFNNHGIEPFVHNLKRWQSDHRNHPCLIGANIGKNKETQDAATDYLSLLEDVYGLSDYITVNISSPNTPGLRDLQHHDDLFNLLSSIMERRKALAIQRAVKIPVLVKIAPDLDDHALASIAEVALATKIDGLIVTNTTISRPELLSPFAHEQGGLSGKPLFAPSTQVLRSMYKLVKGKIPLIGVGGIRSGADAYTKIKAGASLLQVYTGFVYQGFCLVEEINRDLNLKLAADGFNTLSDAVGSEA